MPTNPVVMFALEWCEFSWSVRKMFAHYEVPYRSVDLDSVALSGRQSRRTRFVPPSKNRPDSKRFRKIYIGGTHIGGATELFDAAKDGKMAALLAQSNVDWAKGETRDPLQFPARLAARSIEVRRSRRRKTCPGSLQRRQASADLRLRFEFPTVR